MEGICLLNRLHFSVFYHFLSSPCDISAISFFFSLPFSLFLFQCEPLTFFRFSPFEDSLREKSSSQNILQSFLSHSLDSRDFSLFFHTSSRTFVQDENPYFLSSKRRNEREAEVKRRAESFRFLVLILIHHTTFFLSFEISLSLYP